MNRIVRQDLNLILEEILEELKTLNKKIDEMTLRSSVPRYGPDKLKKRAMVVKNG